MRTLGLLNCGLLFFLLSDFQLSYQQNDRPFDFALIVMMVVMILLHLLFLWDGVEDRRLPLWVMLPYGLLVVGLGLMILLGYAAGDPYWYTLAIFAVGCGFVAAAVCVALLNFFVLRRAEKSHDA